jgi:putative endonuclease
MISDISFSSLRGARFLAYASEQAPQSLLLSLRGAPIHRGDEAISSIICMMTKQYYVYIMTNSRNTVLYVGVTNNLIKRVYEHKAKLADGFTKKYNIIKLVYYEIFEDIENAILREKQIKAGSRQKKIRLIDSTNREWRDLYDEL